MLGLLVGFFSFIIPGLGQLFCGELVAAVVWFAIGIFLGGVLFAPWFQLACAFHAFAICPRN